MIVTFATMITKEFPQGFCQWRSILTKARQVLLNLQIDYTTNEIDIQTIVEWLDKCGLDPHLRPTVTTIANTKWKGKLSNPQFYEYMVCKHMGKSIGVQDIIQYNNTNNCNQLI